MEAPIIGDVASSFSNEAVLLTGGTGFLGKVLIDKLLRSCPDIKHIYLLARHKKGLSIDNRFQEIFKDPLFSVLEKQNPEFRKKLTPVYGDCALPELGLSQQDKELLLSEVGIVLHSAATVRFDETLRVAYNTNIRGTKQLLLLAKQMKSLKAFVHISTAYSHCERSLVEEKTYEVPMDHNKLELVVDNLDDNLLQAIVTKMLGEWPNTYTFTKAIAENVVEELGKGMPVVIFRPGVVVGTAYEPLVGWTDNVYGPTGLVVGAGVGILHSIQGDINGYSNMVPVDMTVAAIIVAAADIIQRNRNKEVGVEPVPVAPIEDEKDKEDLDEEEAKKEETTGHEEDRDGEKPPVYNYVSVTDNPLTWGQFVNYLETHGDKIPTVKAVWCYFLFIHRHRLPHILCVALFHYLPAYIVDAFAAITGADIPNMTKIYKKVDKLSEVLAYFGTRSWTFPNDNVNSLWERLNAEDKKRFDFDIKSLNWDEFFYNYIRGVRIYLVKDDLSTVPRAQVSWARLKLAHSALKLTFFALFGILAYSFFSALYVRIFPEF